MSENTKSQNTNVLTIRVPDDLVAAMVRLHAEVGIPQSEQVRRALRVWLTEQGAFDAKTSKRKKGSRR